MLGEEIEVNQRKRRQKREETEEVSNEYETWRKMTGRRSDVRKGGE